MRPNPSPRRPDDRDVSPPRPQGWDTLTAPLGGVELDFPLLHYVDAQSLLGALEVDYVAWAMLAERGNRSAAARRLNLARTTFLRHMKRLGLEDLIEEEKR